MVQELNHVSSREKEKRRTRTHNAPQDLARRKRVAINGKEEYFGASNHSEFNGRTSSTLHKKRRAYGKQGRQNSRRHHETCNIYDEIDKCSDRLDRATQNSVSKERTVNRIPSSGCDAPQNVRRQPSCDSGRHIIIKGSILRTRKRRTYGRKSRKCECSPMNKAPSKKQQALPNSISMSLSGGSVQQQIKTNGNFTYVCSISAHNFKEYSPYAKVSTVLSAIYRREIGALDSGLKRQCNDGSRSVTAAKKLGKRVIPFSKLQTPVMDAILDFDRTGSYLIGIGNGLATSTTELCDNFFPSLSLRCYAVPSPAILGKIHDHHHTQKVTKHIFTIPLSLDRRKHKQSSGNSLLSSSIDVEEEASASNTPCQILMSHDGSLGVTFVHNSLSPVFDPAISDPSLFQRSEDILGSIIIHPLPSQFISSRIRTIKCSNVRIDGWKHTMRNLLWPAPFVPCAKSSQDESDNIFESYRSTDCGYILFNDEKNGYRIFWIEYSPTVRDEEKCTREYISTSCPRNDIIPTRNDIIIKPYQSGVESHRTDIITGLTTTVMESDICTEHELAIPVEAYLQIDALFSDILCRKKHFISTKAPSTETAFTSDRPFSRMPDFFYNLVSVENARSVKIVIAFSNPCFQEQLLSGKNNRKVPASLGVLVQLDLFDQSYSELEWLQHPSRQGATFLRQWINVLALNHRMKEVGAGPYCVQSMRSSTSNLPCFGVKFHDMNNMEKPQDFDENVWNVFVERRLTEKDCEAEPPHEVSMASLYPFCDLISNRAVTNCIPLTNISCSRCPLELRYG